MEGKLEMKVTRTIGILAAILMGVASVAQAVGMAGKSAADVFGELRERKNKS